MISIAPMVDISNHHFRTFVRLMTKKAILYTEMKSVDAIINNHRKILPFHESQHPIALQIGGCDPDKLAQAARIGEQYGYDQINLNVGCPSNKVQKGEFGVVLMKSAQLVRKIMVEMAKKVNIPCSIKCRLGFDDNDSYEFLQQFINITSGLEENSHPIKHFVIHARKAILNGINPSQNLKIPSLDYEKVYKIKRDFPSLLIHLNGGIKKLQQGYHIVKAHNLQGLMVGRLAIQNPFELTKIDGIQSFQQQKSQKVILNEKLNIILKYIEYIEALREGKIKDQKGNIIENATIFTLIKPFINFYNGNMCARGFRRQLSNLTIINQTNFTQIIKYLAYKMVELNLANSESQKQRLNTYNGDTEKI